MPRYPKDADVFKIKIRKRDRGDGVLRYHADIPKRLMDKLDDMSEVSGPSWTIRKDSLVLELPKKEESET